MSPMCHRFTRCFAAMMTVCLFAGSTLALSHQQSVTPASVKAKDSRVSVEAERTKDGLVQFRITYHLPRPQYLVAHFELRDGETVLAKTYTPSFVHEDSATYHVAVPAKYLKDSKFELSESEMSETPVQPVALPGSIDFQIDLQAFGRDARPAKAD